MKPVALLVVICTLWIPSSFFYSCSFKENPQSTEVQAQVVAYKTINRLDIYTHEYKPKLIMVVEYDKIQEDVDVRDSVYRVGTWIRYYHRK